jgi:hypothetical protein
MHLAAEKIAYLAQGFMKLDLGEVFDLIINELPAVFKAPYSSLFLLNEKNNSLEMVRSNYLKKNYTKIIMYFKRKYGSFKLMHILYGTKIVNLTIACLRRCRSVEEPPPIFFDAVSYIEG